MSVKKDYRVGIAVHSYGPIAPTIYANHVGIFSVWRRTCGAKFLHIDGVKTAGARNMLVKKAMDVDCTHILFIDADHIVNEEMLPNLLGNMECCEVVSGLVVKKDGKGEQVGFLERTDGKFFEVALPSDGLSYEVSRCAFGCTLINLKVFDKIEEPYFKDIIRRDSEGNLKQHRSDMEFCREVRANGGHIRIDTRVQVGHLGAGEVYYPPNLQYQLATYKAARSIAEALASEIDELSCIDFGCGHGRKLIELIMPICPKIVGVDIERRAKGCELAYPDDDVTWVAADLSKPIKPLGKFNIVICADVLEHVGTPEVLLATMRQHMESDGCAIISTPDIETVSKDVKENLDHKKFWNEKAFRKLLKDNGFNVVQLRMEEEITGYMSMVCICKLKDDGNKGSN